MKGQWQGLPLLFGPKSPQLAPSHFLLQDPMSKSAL